MGNPYLIEDGKKPKELDVMGALGKLHWQTELEAQMHILSMRLGQMEGKEYKFLLPGAPSDWPDWYLDAVLSHDTSVKVLRAKQQIEADKKKKASNHPEMPEAEKQKNLLREKAWFIQQLKMQAGQNDGKD